MAEPLEIKTLSIVREFLYRFACDMGEGKEFPLAHYQKLYPGFEERIAREFQTLAADRPLEEDPPLLKKQIGPYRLLGELGQGGQGVVYLADDPQLHRQVALKVLSSGLSFSESTMARFHREAEIASRLQHEGICTVYGAGEADGVAFIAMQYVQGESLARLIQRAREKGNPHVELPRLQSALESSVRESKQGFGDPLRTVVKIIEETAVAAHAVHQVGVIHRDLKPGNIMVTQDGKPVILDFGLAIEKEGGETLTLSGDVLGTPAYLAPERVRGQGRRADARTDVYGLGAILYECITLQRPFSAPTRDGLYHRILSDSPADPRRVNPSVSRDLTVVVATAMEKDPDRRYQDARALAEDLRRIRCREPILARPVGPATRLRRWIQRNPMVAALVTLLFFALLTSVYSLRRTQDSLRHARALTLVGASAAAVESDQAQAVKLALMAARMETNPDTVTQLHSAMGGMRERVLFAGHAGAITKAVASRDGKRFITISSDDRTLKLWDGKGRCLRTLEAEKGTFHDVCLAADGRRFLTAGVGEADLWEIGPSDRVERLARLPHPENTTVYKVLFSPVDPRKVLTTCEDHQARLWRVHQGTASLEHILGKGGGGHRGPVLEGVFSPDGKWVLTRARGISDKLKIDDTSPILWDDRGNRVATLRFHRRPVTSIAFSPHSDRLLTASRDGSVCEWSPLGRGIKAESIIGPGRSRIRKVGYSGDGNRILAALSFQSHAIQVFTKTGTLATTLAEPGGDIWGGMFSPDGTRIVAWCRSGIVQLWHREGRKLFELRGHRKEVAGCQFLPRGEHGEERLLSYSADGTARVWSLTNPELPIIHSRPNNAIQAHFLRSPENSKPWILVTSPADPPRFFTAAGIPLPPDPTRDLAGAQGSIVSRHGNCIITGGHGKGSVVVKIWSWRDGKAREVYCTTGAPLGFRAGAISSDGDLILGQRNHPRAPLQVLDRRGGKVVSFPDIRSVYADFSPTRPEVLVTDVRGVAHLLDYRKQARIGAIARESVRFRMGINSPAGDLIALNCTEGNIHLYRREGLLLVRTLICKTHPAIGLCFDPHGNTLLTISPDGIARRMTLEGNLLARYQGHKGPICCIDFSPDGKRILITKADGTTRMWMVEEEDLLHLAENRIVGLR